MRCKLGKTREVQIGVKHEEKEVSVVVGPGVRKKQQRRTTTVRLTVRENGAKVGTISAMSVCNPLDQFEKIQGRRHALKKLFEPWTKDVQGQRHPKPKKRVVLKFSKIGRAHV